MGKSKDTTEKVEVTHGDMDMIVEGLDRIKADTEKVLASAEKLKEQEVASATKKAIDRIEDLKTKFLYSI